MSIYKKPCFAVLIMFAAVAISLSAPQGAMCQTFVFAGSYHHDDGTTTRVNEIYGNDGEFWGLDISVWDANNKLIYERIDFGNPNPEDGTTEGPGNLDSAIELALQNGELKGIIGSTKPNFGKTPIGKHLTVQGKGAIPAWNPSDDGSEGGQKPAKSGFKGHAVVEMIGGVDSHELNQQVADEINKFNKSKWQGLETNAPIGEQVKDAIKHGQPGSGNGDDTNSMPGYLNKYYSDNPLFAEVSLPNPDVKTFNLLSPSGLTSSVVPVRNGQDHGAQLPMQMGAFGVAGGQSPTGHAGGAVSVGRLGR